MGTYIGVKVPLIRGRTCEEVLSIFTAYAAEAIVGERQEYRWFLTSANEVCVVHSASDRWSGDQAREWLRKGGQLEQRPVWIEQLDDVFGSEYTIELCSAETFKKAYGLSVAEPGRKHWVAFIPGKPLRRVTGYQPRPEGRNGSRF